MEVDDTAAADTTAAATAVNSEFAAGHAILTGVYGAEVATQFVAFYEAGMQAKQEGERPKEKTYLFEAHVSKDQRKEVHYCAREHFKGTLSESYGDDNKQIQIKFGKERGRWDAEQRGGAYLQFHLYKENTDTMEAIDLIARRMKLNAKIFSYAGTKDRRAVTVQRVTALRVTAQRMEEATRTAFRPTCTVKVGNFKYVPAALKLGQLDGNRFTVVLRDCQASREAITTAVDSLKQTGFINFFGLQRFGTGSVGTHEIGFAMLQQDYARAASLLVMPRPGETDQQGVFARKYLQDTGDIRGTLKILPGRMRNERAVLESLLDDRRGSQDFRGAFDHLSRNMRTMFPHAAQSFVWNSMASARIEKFSSTEVIVGDLVADNLPDDQLADASEWEKKNCVRALTEEDVAGGKYTLADVVLPIPGTDVRYPANAMEGLYRDLLAQYKVQGVLEGTTGASVDKKQVSVLNLSGGYRKLVQVPRDVTSQFFQYDDDTVPLATTDLDTLSGQDVSAANSTTGEKLALEVAFTLNSSSYATMCIRELCKQSTSKSVQNKLQEMEANATPTTSTTTE
jgi:tRNA pseudouridine13 synthase